MMKYQLNHDELNNSAIFNIKYQVNSDELKH